MSPKLSSASNRRPTTFSEGLDRSIKLVACPYQDSLRRRIASGSYLFPIIAHVSLLHCCCLNLCQYLSRLLPQSLEFSYAAQRLIRFTDQRQLSKKPVASSSWYVVALLSRLWVSLTKPQPVSGLVHPMPQSSPITRTEMATVAPTLTRPQSFSAPRLRFGIQ